MHLDSVKHDVPRYHFNLTDFAHVLTKGRGSRVLTGMTKIFLLKMAKKCIISLTFQLF